MEKKTVDITLPDLGERTESAKLTAWHLKEGEMVKFDDLLYDVSTDKVEIEVPSPHGGRLVEQFFEVGDDVPVGAVIARLEVES